ncbi:hypothetical protein K435DRAFT_860711 [Dendrothele bispora CBS 962.96]|uniref:Uncharacterized protein n=1 Tax=Dendrothele bispora (strain CBS 962.96) TaxID=1314807 RepID=A0A4S8LX90_DENBC|nr:hypothetical protein K435DRAFT_860711 [Dendrothele bispora CBS 962.96]
MENAELALWDPSKILAGADAAELLILRNTQHTGPVHALGFNPVQSNFLASGAVAGSVDVKAGFQALEIHIIKEPTVAAVADGLSSCERNILIFDLGETFNVSLLQPVICRTSTIVLCITSTRSSRGGIRKGISTNTRALGRLCTICKRALCRLRTVCKRAKRTLSSVAQTTIEIGSL